MLNNLEKYRIILGSNSPRRKELLAGLGLNFEVKPMPDLDESYPESLEAEEIPVFIANKKADAYRPALAKDDLLITADTIVWINNQVLGKPVDREDAIQMLRTLSAHTHEVITGVCLATTEKSVSFSVVSTVRFAPIKEEDIAYYIDTYRPYDKAGAYGIQEWIGYVAVEGIEGSFYNVMGLPIQRVYQELSRF
ncbi:septum formation protein [Parabacteroides sp. PF5-5]|uniref:Maf-like protein n=1 Tax=unclassified Parabacteroides TaxID=2649774 RepID=UPI0024757105|nr:MULTISPECIES: Maf-like protein [unclassified Parabacteroides]MDH6306572.1 septum formation protein [Parabacteroides sp. PH5-39]MDH6317539.1 septum formation protein [Parabacteroides sp. PF5-13]MDH6321283.1 septum formation protein [Parabacteroides sp. PH5-13]MDH6325015.1 septum formation protein [Parabacteroides sp. PH5-8]MDH6328724.1 septum formation protein [Parabacteroides sp. PH5-41]